MIVCVILFLLCLKAVDAEKCRQKRESEKLALHRSKRAGSSSRTWLNDWTDWYMADKCSDNCVKEKVQQSRNRTCNPTNICKLPISSVGRYSGGIVDGSFVWYCKQSMCKGNVATETRKITFDAACPCETCSGEYAVNIHINIGYTLYVSYC